MVYECRTITFIKHFYFLSRWQFMDTGTSINTQTNEKPNEELTAFNFYT